MLLDMLDVTSHYGRVEALHGVSISVAAGELVALVGGNGAGKTTLLRVLSGVRPASRGQVRFDGADITGWRPPERVKAGIVQVPEGRQVFGPMSVEDNIRLGGYTRPAAEAAASLDEAFALFPILAERRRQPAGTLSGGQQQMLAMARAMMAKPRLLLLDEPSMGLAPLVVQEIFRIVGGLKRAGITILLVEQNAQAALAIADRGYVLESGQIVLSDRGEVLLADPRVRAAYLGA